MFCKTVGLPFAGLHKQLYMEVGILFKEKKNTFPFKHDIDKNEGKLRGLTVYLYYVFPLCKGTDDIVKGRIANCF